MTGKCSSLHRHDAEGRIEGHADRGGDQETDQGTQLTGMPLHTGMRERFLKQSGISIYFTGKTGMDKGTVHPRSFLLQNVLAFLKYLC